MRRTIFASLAAVAVFTMALASTQLPAAAGTSSDAGSSVGTYLVYVKTGNLSGAGTDANVYVQLLGTRGSTRLLEMESQADDFERNSFRGYPFVLNDLGDITTICLWRNEAGLFDDWNVEFVRVRSPNGAWYTALFNGWMPPFQKICRRAS